MQSARAGIALLFGTSLLFAQDPRGTLLGRVNDVTQALIPGVEVKARNVETGVIFGARTNESGRYVMPFLIPGKYSVTAENQGFKRFNRDGVQIRAGEATELHITMELGQVSETVDVTDTTPLLDTNSPSLGQVIDSRRILELPTLAGNAFELALLTPGVTNGANLRDRKPAFNNANSQISSDGNGQYNNEFQIDGVSNSFADGSRARVAFSPPQTAIQEFKMQTSTYDASIGHTIGSVVNVSTRSGTNSLHGEAHWFVRNRAFDAPNFFNNKANTQAPVYQDNRYGASAGAPVILPGLYNGKNKTFWFYAWEANKWIVPGNFTGTVPTALQRRGDFSELLAVGGQYQIYDPFSTTPAPNGRFSRTPVAGNRIPAARLDRVGAALANLYPLPNAPGTADGRNNYFNGQLRSLEDYYVHVARVDHAFSDKFRIFARVHYDFWEEDKIDHFNNRINGIILNRINRGFALDQVHVLTPSFLLNVRYGFTQQEFPEKRITQGYDLASLGFSQELLRLTGGTLAPIPRVNAGWSTLSPWESGDGTNTSLTHVLAANFTRLQGTHNLKFGSDFRVYRAFGNRYQTQVAPDFSFANTYTRGPLDTAAAAPFGQEAAAMMFGIPGGSMSQNASYALQNTFLGLYIHDDFKLARNFTLNVGLRYEKEEPITERFNRLNGQFDFTTPNPIDAQARANYARNPIAELPVSQFRALGGVTFVNLGGLDRSPFSGESNNFMPRIGFAWQVRPTMIVRSGYGLFFETIGVNTSPALQTGFSQSTPIQATLDNGVTFRATTANPFPTGLIAPAGPAGGLTTNLNQGIASYYQARKHAYSQRWSFGVQQQLQLFLVEANYVGNRGTRLGIQRESNNTPRQYLSTLPVRDQTTINFLGQNVPNPFAGIDPIYGANISRGNLLRPYPHFGNIALEEPIGYNWYHSLQLRSERRMQNGFTFQLAYTWSKLMEAEEFLNSVDTEPYESISGGDRPHRVAVSGIYEIPVGRGRRFGRQLPAPIEFFAGGWQFNAVIAYQSGQALGFGNAIFVGDINNIQLPSSQRSADRWFNTEAGFNKVAAQQLASNYRTFPLRFSGVLSDSQNRWDFSAIKNFRIYQERVRMQFRAEAFNALNKTILNNPNTAVTNTAFGTITGTQAPARTFQFALKLEF